MNNMGFLRAAGRLKSASADGLDRRLYICLYGDRGSPDTREPLIPGIADQRLSRPEQDHQQDSQDAEHCEHRLVQDHLDHAGPGPGRVALHPGPERLLARLMDVVPELAELGETERLIGDPARPVIDHEDESAGQQQQPYESEKTADHASPYIRISIAISIAPWSRFRSASTATQNGPSFCFEAFSWTASRCSPRYPSARLENAPNRRQPLPGAWRKFNLISHLSAFYG